MCGLIFAIVVTIVVALPLQLLAGVKPAIAWGATAVVALAAAAYLFSPDPRRRYVIKHGEHLMAWLLPGWAHPIGEVYLVMVIYTFDKTVPDLPQFLERVMDRMQKAAYGHAITNDERVVAGWIRDVTSYAMYTYRTPVPTSLTEGREVFCIKARAEKSLLPDGELKLPYIYIAAMRDRPNVAADMVAYPSTT